jgi:REDY-like protein HapK
MAQRILFLTRLQEGADRAGYDRFVREILLPLASSIPSVRSYSVVRLDGLVEEEKGPIPFDYIDVIEVESAEAYKDDIARMTDEGRLQEFDDEWTPFVDDWKAVYGEVIG